MARLIYTKELLTTAAQNSYSVADVLRFLGKKLAGGTYAHVQKKMKQFNIDMSHFTGQAHNKGKTSNNRLSSSEILVFDRLNGRREGAYKLRRALQEAKVSYICTLCGIPPFYNGRELTLEVDHINCDFRDNRKENLRFLCPNCHAQETVKPK